nr:uncharacterized protein LOC129380337 isoform X1 [Dermacentor andersoni]
MYKTFGEYGNFSTTAAFIYGERGTGGAIWGRHALTSTPCYSGKNLFQFVPLNGTGDAVQEMYHTIYAECDTCFFVRHRYVANGYGCSFWRRVSTFHNQADCCEFIYDENCGSTPKYQVYLSSCAPELGMPGI